jgi:hypothetical protein
MAIAILGNDHSVENDPAILKGPCVLRMISEEGLILETYFHEPSDSTVNSAGNLEVLSSIYSPFGQFLFTFNGTGIDSSNRSFDVSHKLLNEASLSIKDITDDCKAVASASSSTSPSLQTKIKRYRILKAQEFDLPNPKEHIYTEYNDDTALSKKRKDRYNKVAKGV